MPRINKETDKRFEVLVEVNRRSGIRNPEADTIALHLPALGFDSITNFQVGKAIRFFINSKDEESARKTVEQITEKALTNPIIEVGKIYIKEAKRT